MRTMQHFLGAIALVALGTFVAFAQAPQQPGRQGGEGRGAGAPAQPGGQGQGQGRGRGQQGPPAQPSFFITSVGKGDGANYGGLAGADAHCAALAKQANLQAPAGRTWRAYLSASAQGNQPAVNARDRIGAGPWHNANPTNPAMIANNVADLHGDVQRDRSQINKNFALSERGEQVNGVGDTPNQHDILTGSDSHGRAIAGTDDMTCSNWTSNASPPAGAARGAGPGAMVGHHDRIGGGSSSWNSAHKSAGCSQANLVATGGAGLLYCFAAN